MRKGFGSYVKEMVGEYALRCELNHQSSSGGNGFKWREKHIEQLD